MNNNQDLSSIKDFNDLENFARITRGLHIALDDALTELNDSVVQNNSDPTMLAFDVKSNITQISALSTVILERLATLEDTIGRMAIKKAREGQNND